MSRHESGETIDVWVLTIDHQWPIRVFTNESHAITASEKKCHEQGTSSHKVHLWKGQLTLDIEMKVVKTEPRLEPKDEA